MTDHSSGPAAVDPPSNCSISEDSGGGGGAHRLSVPGKGSRKTCDRTSGKTNGEDELRSERWCSSDELSSSAALLRTDKRWPAWKLPVSSRCGAATKSRSLGCLMPCDHPGSAGYATPPSAPLLTAQQRRAAFQNASAGTSRSTSPKPARSERTPSVIVSDHSSGECASVETPNYSSDGDWLDGVRRLSSCSSCSTVSSCGHNLSRRGSLVDLEAEGLVLRADGRLERDTPHRRRSSELKRQHSLDPNWQNSPGPQGQPLPERSPTPTRSLDLETSPVRVLVGGEDGVSCLVPSRRSREELEEMRRTLKVSSGTDAAGEAADITRKVSDCSISSVSTLSQDDDDDSDNRDDIKADVSLDVAQLPHWRKVRGVVQWTPFVQTFRNHKYPWVQLAGHQGNFRAGEDGTILKRLCGREQACLQMLMVDVLRPHVPEYRGQVMTKEGETFLQLQDLLSGFREPCVMDCKIGVRTYQEEELAKAREKPKLRKDMYEKMMLIDQTAPTKEEHRLKAVTKPRYMVWRETTSSTATLGFRIEGIRRSDGYSSKDFKTTRTLEQVEKAFSLYTEGYPHAARQHLASLERIRSVLKNSSFFKTHEFIGSSLLFVHDAVRASVWMIDFAKTTPLPPGVEITHHSTWLPGNHEDGYITGIDNLINLFRQVIVPQ